MAFLSVGGFMPGQTGLHQVVPTGVFAARRRTDGWHQIAVVVTPEIIEINWDGLRIARRSRKHLETVILPMWWSGMEKPVIPSVLGSRGSLGLYVERGEAWFRNVVVEPLAP
jgi:hypothetical protein